MRGESAADLGLRPVHGLTPHSATVKATASRLTTPGPGELDHALKALEPEFPTLDEEPLEETDPHARGARRWCDGPLAWWLGATCGGYPLLTTTGPATPPLLDST